MANENKGAAAAKTTNETAGKTVIKPPQKVFRWQDSNTIQGKLTAPIIVSDEKFGRRTRIALETATVLLPARYGIPYAQVPVGSVVTLTKTGEGRDVEYELSHT